MLDPRMRASTGLSCNACLTWRRSTLALILIDAHDEPHDVQKAMSAGADRYFSKPVKPDCLVAAIEAADFQRGRGTPVGRDSCAFWARMLARVASNLRDSQRGAGQVKGIMTPRAVGSSY
jgi:DNA-binding NarL/FixJ family response regulator